MGLKPRLPAPKPRTAAHPSVTERDTETAPPPRVVRRLKHQQTPLGPEAQTQAAPTRGPDAAFSSALQPPVTLSLLTRRQAPLSLTATPSLTHRPRRCVSLTRARAQASSPGYSSPCPLPPHALHRFPPHTLPVPPPSAPISCHFHSSSTLPTGHLCSHLLPLLPGWGKGVQPWVPKKLLYKEGPVAMVPIRWGWARAPTSPLPWLPRSPESPGTPLRPLPLQHTSLATCLTPSLGDPARVSLQSAGREEAVKGCIGGKRDWGQSAGVKSMGRGKREATSRSEMEQGPSSWGRVCGEETAAWRPAVGWKLRGEERRVRQE